MPARIAPLTSLPDGLPPAGNPPHDVNPIASDFSDHPLQTPQVKSEDWRALISNPEKIDVLNDAITVAATIGTDTAVKLLESQARSHYIGQPEVVAKRAAGAALLATCEQSAPLVVSERDVCAAIVEDRPLYDWVCSFRDHAGGFLAVTPVVVEVVVLAAFLAAGLYFEGLNAVYLLGEAGLGLAELPWNCVGLAYAFVAGLLVWQQFATAFQPAAQRLSYYRLISRLALPVGFGALVLYGYVVGSMHETPDPLAEDLGPAKWFKFVLIAALVVLAVSLKCGLTLLSSSVFALWRYDYEPSRQRRRGVVDTAALDHAAGGWRALEAKVQEYLKGDNAAEQAYVDQNLLAYAWRIELAKAETSSAKLKLFKA